MKKILSFISPVLFFGICHITNAQINIKVNVINVAVSTAADCDAGGLGNSDFVFEYKAQDNSPSAFSNNTPVAGSIGMCNYAVVNEQNGPYSFSPATPGSAVFSPTTGLFFDRTYNCKNEVPTMLTITWAAYENDDVSAPSVTPLANGVVPAQANSYTVPTSNGTYTTQYTQTSSDGTCPQVYIIEFEVVKSMGSFSPLMLGTPEANVICTGASDGFVEVDATGGSGTVLYDWSMDGVGDFDDNVQETGLMAGTYTLVVKDALNCRDSAVVTVFSTNAPVNIASFTASTASVCTNQSGVVYSVPTQTNAVFYWSFSGPGGVMNGTGNSITMDFLDFAADGTLSVYAQNSCSTTSILSMSITVVASPNIMIAGNNSMCANAQEVLSASGAVTYTWSTGDNTANATVSPSVATVYTVMATGATGCTSTQQFTMNVSPSPTLQVTGSTVAVCPNHTVAVSAVGNGNLFFWSDGFIGPNHNVMSASTNVFTVTTTFTNSCYTQVTYTLNVLPAPVLSVTGNTAVCEGGTVSLTANGADTYVWSDGVTTNTTSFAPVSSTTLGLVGTGLNGCKDSLVKNISVLQTPTVTISGTDTICEGQTVTLMASANGTVTYGWNNGANTSSISVTPSGTFTYIATAYNGACAGSESHEVFVKLIPTVDFSVSSTPLCSSDAMITFTASPSGGSFNGTGVTMGNMFDPSVGVGSYPIVYHVSLPNGCGAVASQTVEVMLCTGIEEAIRTKGLTVFPNPTASDVIIQSEKEIASILVYDFSGKLVRMIEANAFETNVDMNSLATGFYTFTVTMSDKTQKVIKVVKN
ncbi:MAG: T9SS type A sorting domain-containing protein [Bacteroidota bacterium]